MESKNIIIEKNIALSEKEIYNGLEKRQAHIMQKMSLSKESRDSLFKNENVIDNPYGCIEENKLICKKLSNYLHISDSLTAVCSLDDNEISVLTKENKKEYTVSYLKNSFTDKAYNVFSSELAKCKVVYVENFNVCCENVYYGRTDCCILPIESSDEGVISGFNSMVIKYELKICLTCNIEDREGHFTKYALLKREVTVFENKKADNDEKYLRIFYAPLKTKEELPELLFGAEYFGLNVNRIDSKPRYYSENEYIYDLVFVGKSQTNVNRFLTWLNLTEKSYDLQGVYTHIN